MEELDIYAVGELDMKGVAMLTIYCRFISILSPPASLDLLAGLEVLAFVAASSGLSIDRSMWVRAGGK